MDGTRLIFFFFSRYCSTRFWGWKVELHNWDIGDYRIQIPGEINKL